MPTTRAKRADIPQQILKHATRLFAARGFFGASLRDIAKAVGIRKPSLLYHFPSKDELRQGVLEQMLAHWNEVVPRLLRAASSGHEQFEAVTNETVQFFLADPDRARLLLREMLDRPNDLKPLIETHVQPWVATLCESIRKGQEQGRVHKDVDPEAYTIHVINLVVCGIALQDSIGLLIPNLADEERERLGQRYIQELRGVARRSLFLTPKAGSDSAPPPSPSEQAVAETETTTTTTTTTASASETQAEATTDAEATDQTAPSEAAGDPSNRVSDDAAE